MSEEEKEEELVGFGYDDDSDVEDIYGDDVRRESEEERAEVARQATEAFPELRSGDRVGKRSGPGRLVPVAGGLAAVAAVIVAVVVLTGGDGDQTVDRSAELAAATKRVERLETRLEEMKKRAVRKRAVRVAEAKRARARAKARKARQVKLAAERKKAAKEATVQSDYVPDTSSESVTSSTYTEPTYVPEPSPAPAPAPAPTQTNAQAVQEVISPLP